MSRRSFPWARLWVGLGLLAAIALATLFVLHYLGLLTPLSG